METKARQAREKQPKLKRFTRNTLCMQRHKGKHPFLMKNGLLPLKERKATKATRARKVRKATKATQARRVKKVTRATQVRKVRKANKVNRAK